MDLLYNIQGIRLIEALAKQGTDRPDIKVSVHLRVIRASDSR